MRRRSWTVLAAVALTAAIVAVPSALAAYASPKLEVRLASTGVTIKAVLSPDDDPTASVRIFVPAGTQLTTNQAPGTVLGPVQAVVKALDLGGADLPLAGNLIVAAPGQIAPREPGCVPRIDGTDRVMGDGALRRRPDAAGTGVPGCDSGCADGARARVHPGLPASARHSSGAPGRATFGAKLYSAELNVAGVFSSAAGVWVSFWTPYNPGVGTLNGPASVASPAAVLTGALTSAAKKAGKGAVVSGRVTQGGQPRRWSNRVDPRRGAGRLPQAARDGQDTCQRLV